MTLTNKHNKTRNSIQAVTRILTKTLCVITLLCISYECTTQWVTNKLIAIEQANIQRAAELACVRKKIAQGIPRIDIATKYGQCWYEDNGYYNYR